ncbi:hypothetical protein G5I_09645 [Acromyrmex echinatior]|uniref:Uncharacterized protein n=1 Tax=Acromyrmex echinatior TaxID=103372 RepID=F4WUR8_ACREC|nr:hypothetical protein G5I_09645 [Acromyrmex echinatior]
MMYSETTGDEAVAVERNMRRKGIGGDRMLLPVYRATMQYVARLGHAMKRCGGETRRWSTEERPFRLVSADKNLRVGRTEKEEERKLQEAEAIDGREVKRRHRSQQKSFCPPSRTIVYTTSPILGGERRLSGAEGREMKRAAKETRVRAGDPGRVVVVVAGNENGGTAWGEHGGAEVSGKLNLAQDVTAPGNTGVSVR